MGSASEVQGLRPAWPVLLGAIRQPSPGAISGDQPVPRVCQHRSAASANEGP